MGAQDVTQVKGQFAAILLGTCGKAAKGSLREEGKGSKQI